MNIFKKENHSKTIKSDYITPSWAHAWWRPWMGYVLAMIGFLWYNKGFKIGLK